MKKKMKMKIMNRYEEAIDKVARYCSDARTGNPRFYETDIGKELTTLQELAEQQETPTLKECLKKWEERGWKEDLKYKDKYRIQLKKLDADGIFTGNFIIIFLPDKKCYSNYNFTFEEHELLNKTVKALEVENEQN